MFPIYRTIRRTVRCVSRFCFGAFFSRLARRRVFCARFFTVCLAVGAPSSSALPVGIIGAQRRHSAEGGGQTGRGAGRAARRQSPAAADGGDANEWRATTRQCRKNAPLPAAVWPGDISVTAD